MEQIDINEFTADYKNPAVKRTDMQKKYGITRYALDTIVKTHNLGLKRASKYKLPPVIPLKTKDEIIAALDNLDKDVLKEILSLFMFKFWK